MRIPYPRIPIDHQGIYPITHRPFLLKLPTHAQHLPLPKIQDPLNTESNASCSAHQQSFVFTPSNPCHGRAGHRVIRDCGRLNIHSCKIASMSRRENYQDSLLKYRGSSFTLFVNFARFHLLGWISSIQCRLLLTASYVSRVHPSTHLQTTTPTPQVTIQLPIIFLYRTFHVPTRGYIRHRKTGISSLPPSYPFLPKKKTVKMTACLL